MHDQDDSPPSPPVWEPDKGGPVKADFDRYRHRSVGMSNELWLWLETYAREHRFRSGTSLVREICEAFYASVENQRRKLGYRKPANAMKGPKVSSKHFEGMKDKPPGLPAPVDPSTVALFRDLPVPGRKKR